MDTTRLGAIIKAQRDLYLNQGDNILVVVTESFRNAPIADVLGNWKYHLIEIDDVERPGEEYPLPETLMEDRTVGWIISNVSLSHSVGAEMIKHGMFLISNPGITEDWLEVLNPANAETCQLYADIIEEKIGGNVGGEIHVTADDGTNLHLKVPNGNWMKETGKREGTGTNGLFGESATAPYEANGIYVLRPGDFLTNPVNRVDEEIILIIEGNAVMNIKGQGQAEALRRVLFEADYPLAFNLGEFAIGINPAKPKEVFRSVVAEKLLGGIHIAIGTNSVCLQEACPEIEKFKHGRYNAGIHIDAIKFGPSVFFKPERGGRMVTILEEGKLMTT